MCGAAQSLNDGTIALWAHAFTVDPAISTVSGQGQTTQGTNIALATDGTLLAFGNVGAGSESDRVLFGDNVIAVGTPYYNGTASPMTFCLTKIATDGTPQWCVYASNGEIASGNGRVMPTADGGAVVVTALRVTQGAEGLNPTLIGPGYSQTITSPFLNVEKRFYCPFVVKVDGDGKLLWTKLLTVETEPAAGVVDTEFISGGVTVADAAMDAEGNIYFAGNQRAAIYIDGQTIMPHNINGWDGDSQKSVGNAFLIKLDNTGKYVGHVTTAGEITQDNIRCLAVDGDKIYALLHMTGNGESTTVSLAGKSVEVPATTNLNLAAICFDSDLSALWFNIYPNTLNTKTPLQVPSFKVIGDNLWLAAEGQLGLMAGGKDVNTAKLTRDALLIKFDKTTGEALDGITLGKGWSGFFDIAPCDGNHILAAWFNGLYAPAMLGKVNCATLEIDEQVQLCSSVATAQNIIINDDRLYAMLRVRGNVTFGSTALSVPQFACVIAAFNIPAAVGSPLDINNDGSVDVGDVNTILEAIIAGDTPMTLDLNGDKSVDVGDVNTLLDAILKS